jgi:SAM-dependent methyltransferase
MEKNKKMIKCLYCTALSEVLFQTCKMCSVSIERKNGFFTLSPNTANDGEGFKIESFAFLANLEINNFWFNARNKLISWLIYKFNSNLESFLEIGCGTGYVLTAIEKQFPKINLYGSELFVEGLAYASKRVPKATFMQMDARNIPFINEFDSIGLFDVLEHINEDTLVLENIFGALKPNGFLFITVPQHQWLWSQTDEMACHVRRYHTGDLDNKLKSAGFEVVFSSSFVFFLLPAMMLSRLLQNKKQTSSHNEFEIPRFLNFIFEKILNFEVFLMKKGIRFPIGGSRIMVAKKR